MTQRWLSLVAVSLMFSTATAQEMEPRSFSPAPVGLQFVVVAAIHSEGDLVFDPSLPVEDAEADVNALGLAYVRTVPAFGMTGKILVAVPLADGTAQGLLGGDFRTRDVRGLGDLKVGFSLLFFGAPAMEAADYRREDTVAGISLTLGVPVGQYDEDRIINIGTNRWSLRTELGITHRRGPWHVELSGAASFFTNNHAYLVSSTREQDPIWSAQAHVVRDFKPRLWLALDATYYLGGQSFIDGVASGLELSNSRVGLTLSLPLARAQSLKLAVSSGVSARTGTDFTTVGLAWQLMIP